MVPLYRDEFYTFTFADARLISRFHLAGAPEGWPIEVYRLDPASGCPTEQIGSAVTGPGGWVDLPAPLVVRAGGGFLVRLGESTVNPESLIDMTG
jgi:hypothetical protein